MTHEDDLPAEVRRQDEEDELQIAAQLSGLREEERNEEHVSAARRRWSNLSKRTRVLLITAAVADGSLRVAALIDIQRRPASQIRGRKWMWATAVALAQARLESCQSHTSSSGSVASLEGAPGRSRTEVRWSAPGVPPGRCVRWSGRRPARWRSRRRPRGLPAPVGCRGWRRRRRDRTGPRPRVRRARVRVLRCRRGANCPHRSGGSTPHCWPRRGR